MFNNPEEVQKAIDEAVKSTPVILFVKGSPEMPMCGFSKGVMDLFSHLGVEFKTVDVLADPLLRDGIKQYKGWPTIPQVYIKGELVGGFDICREMYESGDLQAKLAEVKQK